VIFIVLAFVYHFYVTYSVDSYMSGNYNRLWETLYMGTVPILEKGVGFDKTVRTLLLAKTSFIFAIPLALCINVP
jgi:hypothetical protein